MKQIEFIPIEERTMNDKLVNLYGKHLVGLYTENEKIYRDDQFPIKPAAPLLIELEQNDSDGTFPYETADLRVMIFGRENNNWNDTARRTAEKGYTNYTYNFNLQTTDDILAEIKGKHGEGLAEDEEIFGLTDIYADYCYYDSAVAKRQFTRRMNQFIAALQQRVGEKRVGYVWNNLFKIGRGGTEFGGCCGQSPDYIKAIEKAQFDVVRKEVEILAPDVVVFMTGTAVDNAIMEKFGLPYEEFPHIDSNLPHLRRVEIPGIQYAARTIHPARKSNADFDTYTNALINDIVKHL